MTFKEKLKIINELIEEEFQFKKEAIEDLLEDWYSFEAISLQSATKDLLELDGLRFEIENLYYSEKKPIGEIENIQLVIPKVFFYNRIKNFSNEKLTAIGELYEELYGQKWEIPNKDTLPF
ncbi:MAG: hypothetical protein K6F77_09920 [Lachnospiraceae bacterium]|nr:hypothetical protein [Lachnospiraceae bacterium]